MLSFEFFFLISIRGNIFVRYFRFFVVFYWWVLFIVFKFLGIFLLFFMEDFNLRFLIYFIKYLKFLGVFLYMLEE